MVIITITDPVNKMGIVLKANFYEDALSLLRTMHDYCTGFKKFSVTIEWKEQQ